MMAKYWMTLLVLTVFPAPDSPLRSRRRRRRGGRRRREMKIIIGKLMNSTYKMCEEV